MKDQKIRVVVTKEAAGYSATAKIGDDFIGTQDETLTGLTDMVAEAISLLYDSAPSFDADNIIYEFDLQSFFAYYKVINVSALAGRIGMNQSLIAQYAKGIKKPTARQAQKILAGVQKLGKELSEIRFLL